MTINRILKIASIATAISLIAGICVIKGPNIPPQGGVASKCLGNPLGFGCHVAAKVA